MVELCLMASHGCPSGLVFHPDRDMCRVSKDCQPFLASPGSRKEKVRSGSLNSRPHQCVEPWKPISGLSEAKHFVGIDSAVRRPVLIDVQDTRPDSILFSFGIAEQCTRHEKILQFLMSGSNEVEWGGLDCSILSDLMGLQALTIDTHQQPFAPDYISCAHDAEAQPCLIYPSREFYPQKPFWELMGDLVRSSDITAHPDGRVSFIGAGSEMKDILSIIAEFYLSKNSTSWRKQSVVPHFNWLDSIEARANIHGSSLKFETVKVAPLKSPEKIKLKPSPKKKTSKKAGRERDLYRKSYLHACESLLSIMMTKRRPGKTAFLSLKNSGPELPQLLTQFSASIAGTGLAVLFSVICKVACGRVTFLRVQTL
ncbi:hypothetical protein F0562_002587 [Nyssa sinensis]|uniref:Uncharacterized protein n=1 Tax=Nyssa sinensis TaxID=561372 RepID=A0A5J5C6A0_9ASTE|nr:hypothetical protein F0562_002587 [Nyssa sinensis]